MIAKVLIDSPLPHLDRPFDYLIPPSLDALAIGTRVRVPFAGRLVTGIVVGLAERSEANGLKAVKSAAKAPTFSQGGLELAYAVSKRYGGAPWDMLRLMAPARVASVEVAQWPDWPDRIGSMEHVYADGPPLERRTLWSPVPRDGELLPAREILGWALGHMSDGGSAIIVMPDARHVAAMMAGAASLGLERWTPRKGGDIAVLDADDGPSLRYASHLAAMRGRVRLVIGTRVAAWQDVPGLAAIAMWDEAAAAYAEPRAPYPHARTVAAMRAQDQGAALLIAGRMLSADAVALAAHGFVRERPRESNLDHAPMVEIIDSLRREEEGGSGRHWLPGAVWSQLVAAASAGVAGVVVPQAGYGAGLACARCGEIATCTQCGGDLARHGAAGVPRCADCAVEHPAWHCASCAAQSMSPVGLGVERAAAQLRAALPALEVATSAAASGVLSDGEVTRGIVVATPGALPAVEGGYGLVVVVNAKVNVGQGLGAEAAAARRWVNAGALARGRRSKGVFAVVGDLPDQLRAALVTWEGAAIGHHDLTERVEADLPPHRRAVWVGGDAHCIAEASEAARACGYMDVLPAESGAWMLASRSLMQDVVDALRAVAVERSAKGASALVLRVDAPLRAGAPEKWAHR